MNHLTTALIILDLSLLIKSMAPETEPEIESDFCLNCHLGNTSAWYFEGTHCIATDLSDIPNYDASFDNSILTSVCEDWSCGGVIIESWSLIFLNVSELDCPDTGSFLTVSMSCEEPDKIYHGPSCNFPTCLQGTSFYYEPQLGNYGGIYNFTEQDVQLPYDAEAIC